MLTEIMQKNSVQKLKGLLKDRYGMGLQITSMISVTDMDVRHMNSEVRGNSLLVPICARGKYLATAILVLDKKRTESISESDISAVTEMVRLVLEPALFSLYIERQELNTRAELTGNVYSFPLMGMGNFDDSGWNQERPGFNSSLILLESFNPHTISRIAVHIHEAGNRWALMRYQELRESIKNLKDLRELGPMTLLIEDILQLSPEEQLRIAEFASEANPYTEPLILIGCTTPLKDLLQREMLSPKLSEVVLGSRLELDRMPKEFSKLRETVELTLDKHSMLGLH